MLREFRKEIKLMGSAFELIVVDDAGSESGWHHIEESIAEIKRIESLLTEFNPDSQTSLINRNAGISPVAVDAEIYNIIQRSIQLSELSQGAFDITSGVLKKLYNFKGGNFDFPSGEMIREALSRTGYGRIELGSNNTVCLTRKGMHIAFGAIGKGYAADKVKSMLITKGIMNGVINASGDLTAWGKRADESEWKVGIADPNDKNNMLLWLPVSNSSVATSGDYEQNFVKNGVCYSHTINPKTGYPTTGIRSVSVISQSAELSDALATAVFVMGREAGLYMIEQLPGVHCVIVDAENRVYLSPALTLIESRLPQAPHSGSLL